MSDIPILDLKILKTFVSDGASIFPMPTIEFEGKFWLVPQWLISKDGEVIRPVRIICLDGFQFQDLREKGHPAGFGINTPLPKGLLEGRVPLGQAAKYEVVEMPPILIRKPPTLQ